MRKAGLAAVGLLSLLASSCWYLKQGTALLNLYCKAKPIEAALAAGGLTPAEKAMLERALEIRAFAMGTIGLKANANYSAFVKTDRDHLADVVSACPADSFDDYRWDYPVVGSLPYKGFFDAEEARAEGERLKREGYDVLVRPVDAFSTLGALRDPLFSFMADYAPYRLANLIVHEQTHATVYLAGRADFNESLASFVGDRGALLWVEAKYGKDSAELRAARDADADSALFDDAMHELYLRLDAAYTSLPTREERLAEKARIIAAFKAEFKADWLPRFKNKGYSEWVGDGLDNAWIGLFRTYSSGADRIRAAYEAAGADLPRFVAIAARVPPAEADPLAWLERECGLAKERGAGPTATAP